MIRARHPTVADDVVIALSANLGGLHSNSCRRRLQDAGFDAPEWGDLSRGLRPGQQGLDDAPEPGTPRHRWQWVAAQEADASFFRGVVWPRLTLSEQALSRSQGGPMAGLPFTCCLVSPQSRFDAQVFRVLLLRRLWCPLPLSGASCRCGRPLDSRGHHRAACHLAGFGSLRFSLESAAARICREAGARVSLNRVQDLDLLLLGSQDN